MGDFANDELDRLADQEAIELARQLRTVRRERDGFRQVAENLQAERDRLRDVGIPCELFCPECGYQHVDAPEPEKGWTNPPHRKHLCHGCGHIWQPYPVATFGVQSAAQDVLLRLLKALEGNVSGAALLYNEDLKAALRDAYAMRPAALRAAGEVQDG